MKRINLVSIKSPKKDRFLKRFLPIMMVAATLVLAGFIASFLSGPASVFRFILQEGSSLKSDDGRVNVLLLGNAGGLHDGAYLTDTIMVASYNLKDGQAYLISLPRDLWIEETKAKLNAVYEIGEEKNGQGLEFSKKVLGEILGIPIHYGVRLDFRGFIKSVNEVGGIEVEVERSFQDSLYPLEGKEDDLCGFVEEEKEFNEEEAKKLNIEPGKRKVLVKDGIIATDSAEPDKGFRYFGCRYETISFTKGVSKMDGEVALKFVRSRTGSNSEGSDFARSKRQQKVIEAFRGKVLSLETLASPTKVKNLIENFGESFETDVPVNDSLDFYRLIKDVKKSQSYVLGSSGKNALLVNPPLQDYGGAWVLIPKGNNFNEIKQYVTKILRGEISEYEATTSARSSDR